VNPKLIVKALQYLYYTGDGINRLKGSPVSDYSYDEFCKVEGIESNGGSDVEATYSKEEVEAAELISKIGRIP
jgi:hypothetical protein